MRRYEHGGDIYKNNGITLDFSINTNPLGMPETARRALEASIDTFTIYPDCRCSALRKSLAEKHGIRSEYILCGNGAADLIFRVCACLKPKRALTLAPAFSEYERPVTLFGGEMLEHHLREADGFALTESILNALSPAVELLFLCNPNNPTGKLAPFDLLHRIAETCLRNGTLLIVDECFIEFTDGPSLIPLLAEFPNLLILRAFTKFYALAGLRLGYLLCSDTILLERIATFGAEWSVSAAAQAAGIGALKEASWAERTLRVVRAERVFLQTHLAMLGLTVFSSDTNFLLIRSSKPLYGLLKAKGLLVRSCENFTGLDERYIRVGLKTHEKNMVLLSAIEEALRG